MAKLIVKDGKLCVSDGRLVTDAGGAPCVCGGGSSNNGCPPTCFRIQIQGVMSYGQCPHIGGTDIASPAIGVNGTFVLTQESNPYTFSGVFPVSLRSTTYNPDGTQAYDWIGTEMQIRLIELDCDQSAEPDPDHIESFRAVTILVKGSYNGVPDTAYTVQMYRRDNRPGRYDVGPWYNDNQGDPVCGSQSGGGDAPEPLTINQFRGGRIRITKPPECDEPRRIVIARECADPENTIAVDLADMPAGSLSVAYGFKLYGLTGEPTDDGPVTVDGWSPNGCANDIQQFQAPPADTPPLDPAAAAHLNAQRRASNCTGCGDSAAF